LRRKENLIARKEHLREGRSQLPLRREGVHSVRLVGRDLKGKKKALAHLITSMREPMPLGPIQLGELRKKSETTLNCASSENHPKIRKIVYPFGEKERPLALGADLGKESRLAVAVTGSMRRRGNHFAGDLRGRGCHRGEKELKWRLCAGRKEMMPRCRWKGLREEKKRAAVVLLSRGRGRLGGHVFDAEP